MSEYTRDGGVIPSGIPLSVPSPDAHYEMWGVYRGIIVQVIYPDDPRSKSRDNIEYIVKVEGQEYPNAIDVSEGPGGIFNYRERIRKGVERSFAGGINPGTYDENTDGEAVWVMFIKGHGDVPLIVGSGQHPRRSSYKKGKRVDGVYDVWEFNGIEFGIDKDSNYTIKHVGRKNPLGKILNPEAANSQIKMSGNGDIELNAYGTAGTSDLRLKLSRVSKTAELYAQDNKIVMNATGVMVQDKNLNTVTMDSAGTKVVDKQANKLTMSAAGIEILDKNANKVTQDSSGTIILDKNGNKITMSSSGIEILDKNGNKITMGASGININSAANIIILDGSVYGEHGHVGNLGILTDPPLDANTE